MTGLGLRGFFAPCFFARGFLARCFFARCFFARCFFARCFFARGFCEVFLCEVLLCEVFLCEGVSLRQGASLRGASWVETRQCMLGQTPNQGIINRIVSRYVLKSKTFSCFRKCMVGIVRDQSPAMKQLLRPGNHHLNCNAY